MKKIVLIFSGALLLSCGESKDKEVSGQVNEENIIEETTVTEAYKRGEEFSMDKAITTNELASMLESQDSAVVTLKGTINAVCKKKGCWMTMPIDNETDLRVRFKDYAFFVPLNCEEQTAYVQGVAKKDVISVEELKHYAEDNGEPQETINAITEPETEYSFLANGVVVE